MRKRAPVLALVLALVMVTACGSVSKTAYNGLVELKAVYTAGNASRTAYCAPLPEPKPVDLCKEQGAAYKALFAGYETLKTGTDLLAAYVQTKGADLKIKLQLLVPVIAADVTEILKLTIPPPAK